MAALLDDGLDLSPLTVLVGENGSGKSTIVEALAMAFGMSAEGGSTGARNGSRVSDAEFDRLVRNVYKVLLTRGMRGTLIYSTDEETRALLRALVP